MVRAILAGNKTQTRRVIKPQPVLDGDRLIYDRRIKGRKVYVETPDKFVKIAPVFAPYQVGDTLWVREAWARGIGKYLYRADVEREHDDCVATWKPSIFMPREAARIFLHITGVQAERVQYISEADAISEGVESAVLLGDLKYRDYYGYDGKGGGMNISGYHCIAAIASFRSLWDSINRKRGFGWEVNPFVFCYDFERLEGNNAATN
jgi:hypothetical protein